MFFGPTRIGKLCFNNGFNNGCNPLLVQQPALGFSYKGPKSVTMVTPLLGLAKIRDYAGDVQSGIILNMPLHATPCQLKWHRVARSGVEWHAVVTGVEWRRAASSGMEWHGIA